MLQKHAKDELFFPKVDEFWISMNRKDAESLSGIDIKFSNPREQKDY